MEFISPEGDTLALGDDLTFNIDRAVVDSVSFFYYKGYLEIIKESKIGSLSKMQMFDIISAEKIGAYNLSSPTSAIGSINSYIDPGYGIRKFIPRENITIKLKTLYFFGNEYKLFVPANRKNLEKLFRKKKVQIESFLAKHQVNFGKEEDLKRLFDFISEPDL